MVISHFYVRCQIPSEIMSMGFFLSEFYTFLKMLNYLPVGLFLKCFRNLFRVKRCLLKVYKLCP